MRPDTWRAFFKEPYRRFYGYIRSGAASPCTMPTSYLAPIVDDMAEIGIQVWQGTLPENDIPALQQHLRGKLVLMGGIGAAIDREDAAPGRSAPIPRVFCAPCCPGGHFIPCITYGLPGAVYPHIDRYIDQTIDAYNAYSMGRSLTCRRCPGSIAARGADRCVPRAAEEPGDTLSALALALRRGQQKKVLTLAERALRRGWMPRRSSRRAW